MRFQEPSGSRAIARMVAAALIAAGAAGCSNSNRFGDNAISNPFGPRSEAAAQAVPAEAAPLGVQTPTPRPPPPGPAPSYYSTRDTTGSLAADSSASSGGITITVGPGDTVHAIARRYRVSSAAIVRANHLTTAASVPAGQRLVIPGHRSAFRPVAAAAPK